MFTYKDGFSFLSILMFTISFRICMATPLDKVAINLNLNDTPEGPYIAEDLFDEDLFEKAGKTFTNSGPYYANSRIQNDNELFKKASKAVRNSECGLDNGNTGGMDYISGGSTVPDHEYPWMVHMLGQEEDGNYMCGGSLITPTVVLTAAHCFKKKISWDGVKVGVADIYGNNYQVIKPKQGLWPNFRHFIDIGILILERAVDLSHGNVGTICLPKRGKKYRLNGKNAVAIGYGKQYNNTFSSNLKQVTLKIENLKNLNRKDRRKYKKDKKLYLFTKPTTIDEIPQGTCRGDSGGPLQYRENGRWTIIGVLMGRGYFCQEKKYSDNYQGFTQWSKVSAHLDWIHCVIKNVNGCNSRRVEW